MLGMKLKFGSKKLIRAMTSYHSKKLYKLHESVVDIIALQYIVAT